MRTSTWPCLLGVLLFTGSVVFGSACQSRPPEPPLQPEYTTTATIKDLMLSLVDPSADVVWGAVKTSATANGIVENRPATDKEWAAVRQGAIRLAEATNLLIVPGRHVAQPGEKSKAPGIELAPEEMEVLINKDRAGFLKLAKALHESSLQALQAIDAKDATKLFDVGEGIDQACENCHLHYWYPNQVLPPQYRLAQDQEGGHVGLAAAPNTGTIKGRVRLTGTPPGNAIIRMGADPMCGKVNAGKRVIQESVLTSADGGLANVFIRLQGALPPTAVPAEPVAIDQRGCVYVPRMVGARVGQTLQIHNSDPTMHNLHSSSAGRNAFNISQPVTGMTYEFRLEDEEIVLRLHCDVHRWMTAYVGVVNNPYFAVSSTAGTFEIANVPVGNYTVQTWHEQYGSLTHSVHVTAGAPTVVDLAYTGAEKPPLAGIQDLAVPAGVRTVVLASASTSR